MSNSLEATKYIKKLIKIIYEKEKTIEQLKQGPKDKLAASSDLKVYECSIL